MRSFHGPDDQGGVDEHGLRALREPIRWADMPRESLGAAGRLIVTPPPIHGLPGDVAMRVRANVLRARVPSNGSEAATLGRNMASLKRNAASLKLGGIAIGAALFGASAMTAISSVQDERELRVVASRANTADEARSAQGNPPAETQQRSSEGRLPREVQSAQQAKDNTANVVALRGASNSPAVSLRPGYDAVNEDPSETPISSRNTRKDHTVHEGLTPDSHGHGLGSEKDTSGAELEAAQSRQSTTRQLSNTAAEVDVLEAPAASVARAQPAPTSETPELELLTQTEAIERPVVRPQFRRVTAARKQVPRATLSSLEEETLLLEQARSKLGRAPGEALTLALEHQSRFRQGQLFEQRRMIHLEALLRLGRDDEARKLAGSIGSSIYQARALALLVRYGIVVE